MDQSKIRKALVVCVILFIAALIVSGVISNKETAQVEATATSNIVISEVLADNGRYPAPNGAYLDFVEVRNISENPVDISGYMLSDAEDSIDYTFPAGTVLQPDGHIVCWCDKNSTGTEYATFGISKNGTDTIYLYNSDNVLIDEKAIPVLTEDVSYVRLDDGSWEKTDLVTPGFENTEEGKAAWLAHIGAEGLPLVITEVMSSNRSTVTNANGEFCDWVEFYNSGEEILDLTGLYFSDSAANPYKWQFPEIFLAPYERTVLCCSKNAAPGDADFGLSKDGCTLIVTGVLGNNILTMDVPALTADRVWAMQEDGTYVVTELATPGFENTEEGRSAYNASYKPEGPLLINEVMPSNDNLMRQYDGECYDWAEIVNISDSTINLSDFYLTDDADVPNMFKLPDTELAAGESIVIICSGNTELTGSYIHAPFTLGRDESWLYIADSHGAYIDCIRIYDVPYRCSVGRVSDENGTFYFAEPTPGAENGTGVEFISGMPVATTAEGVYDGVDSISVGFDAAGTIYYTTDGREPDKYSILYEGPLELTKTTVLRAICYEEGKMPSEIITTTYIINENHTLPVVSMVANPGEMNYMYYNYKSSIEIPGSLSLYENGEKFTIDCGLEMHGHTGLEMPKKSFKINFRGKYDGLLNFPVFGEDGPMVYDALCLRSGQDYGRAIIREQLFTSLCLDATDDVLAQRDKYCILYINGKYHGIYCLKEAFSNLYYAENQGVDEESVTMVQAPVGHGEFLDLIWFCQRNDMSKTENYEYVASKIDIDSLIDWMIMQAYCSNGDVQQNLRYYKSSQNGDKYMFAFYDLDWAFYFHTCFSHVLDPEMGWQHLGMTANLMESPVFRQKFLERVSYHMNNTLTDEIVLGRIDYYQEMLEPEIERERDRWGGTAADWRRSMDVLREFILEDHWDRMISNLDRLIGLTDEEMELYFGG